MKKKFFWAGVILVFLGLIAWVIYDVSGNTNPDVDPIDSTAVVTDSVEVTLDAEEVSLEDLNVEGFVERSVTLDKEFMLLTDTVDEYRWYETCILLNGFMDEMTNYEITGVANIFQKENNGIISVYLRAHTIAGVDSMVVMRNNFWVEDFDLNECDSVPLISASESFNAAHASNYKLPHSAHIVLRREVGPVPGVFPQYIFGNNLGENRPIYVDAVTAEVTDVNPTGIIH